MRLRWNDEDIDLADHALAQSLVALGAKAGHRIAVLAGNTPLHVLLHVAARRNGWTLVPLSLAAPPSLDRCDIVVQRQGAAALEDWQGPLLVATDRGEPVGRRAGRLPPPGEPGPAYVLRTSGTTGEPHRIPVTWEMLDAHAAAASHRIGDSKDAVWSCVLGLHRVGGVALLSRALHNGSTILLEPAYDARRLAQHLRDGVTHVSLVPTMLRRLLDAWGHGPPPATLRCVLLGGDRAPEGLVQPALAAGWPVYCTYGMTESCSQAATATPDERRNRPGTSGRPIDGVHIEAVDGELVVSGATVAGGVHATGDLGRVDAEGFVFVTGRVGDRITSGGAKVEPGTVEDVLRAHPAVVDACVVGLPDPEWGERVVAVVVLRGGHMPELATWCRTRLDRPEIPKVFLQAES
ncbi:MAG: AMP-binding protein, partial [Halobacteriales archaeon]|nr:AMP-binding protein [Halobacteriales archaeon]